MVISKLWRRTWQSNNQSQIRIGQTRPKRRLEFDRLEDRVVPTLMISLQEVGVNGGAPTVVGTASDFTAVEFTGTYGDFTLKIFGGSSDNGAGLSDLLSSTTSIQNNSTDTKTLMLMVFQDNYTLPAGTPLTVESGLGGTVNQGTLSYDKIFQAYASSTNDTNFDITNGPQTAVPNMASFDTGGQTGQFNRTAGQPYSLLSTVTLTLSGGGKINYSDHVTVTASAAPDLLITKTADKSNITAGQTAGFTVTITNTGTSNANGVTLNDLLPLGSATPNDLNWKIDTTTGDFQDFTINGSAGTQQSLVLSQSFINAGDFLAPGQTITVHITTTTSSGDGGGGGAQASNPSNFNGTAIQFGSAPGGSYVWYNSHFAAQNMPTSGTVTFHVTNQKISLPSYTDPVTHATIPAQQLNVPDGVITYTDAVTVATTTFTSGHWVTIIPLSYTGNVFFSGLAFQVPANGLPGGLNPVTWTGNFTVDQTLSKAPSLQWQWAAAAYTKFDSTPGTPGFQDADYQALQIKPVDSNTLSASQNSDHAGVPEGSIGNPATPVKNFVIGGARGGGGSNWTGSNSGTIKVTPTKGGGQLVNTASVTASNVTSDSDDTSTATVAIAMALVTGDSWIPSGADGVVGANFSLAQGAFLVYVDNSNGAFTRDEMARIDDAVAVYNAELAPRGLTLIEVGADQASMANITISMADTTVIGGVADGVLGATLAQDGTITLVNGWNWYTGADPGQVGAGQYDFETVAMHELGHSIGLGHSPDLASVMYPSLGTEVVRRDLSGADLSLIDSDAATAPEPLLAAGFSAPGVRDISAQPETAIRDTSVAALATEHATGIMASAPTSQSLLISSLANLNPSTSFSAMPLSAPSLVLPAQPTHARQMPQVMAYANGDTGCSFTNALDTLMDQLGSVDYRSDRAVTVPAAPEQPAATDNGVIEPASLLSAAEPQRESLVGTDHSALFAGAGDWMADLNFQDAVGCVAIALAVGSVKLDVRREEESHLRARRTRR